MPTQSPPAIVSPSPAPLFKPLSCTANPVVFGTGEAGVFFVCRTEDGKTTYEGVVPLRKIGNAPSK